MTPAQRRRINPLTPRQREVVELILQGDDAGVIAIRLGISIHTLNWQLKDIGKRLGVRATRPRITAYVLLGND